MPATTFSTAAAAPIVTIRPATAPTPSATSWPVPANASIVSLVGYSFTSFAQIKAAMTRTATALLDLGNGETLRFLNQNVQNFAADDFKRVSTPRSGTLTFNDDFDTFKRFNGVDGTWGTKHQWHGLNAYTNVTNNERQIYVDSDYDGVRFTQTPEPIGLNPFSVGNGSLQITAGTTQPELRYLMGMRPYYSGMISTFTSFQQTYGYFEIRAQLPSGQAFVAGLLDAAGRSRADHRARRVRGARSGSVPQLHDRP